MVHVAAKLSGRITYEVADAIRTFQQSNRCFVAHFPSIPLCASSSSAEMDSRLGFVSSAAMAITRSAAAESCHALFRTNAGKLEASPTLDRHEHTDRNYATL